MTTKPTGVWLQDQDLLYRLADTKHGVSNCDEIRVTQVDGSRTMERCIERAAELMAALRASNGQAPAGAANDQRELLEDAAFLLRKYRRLCVEIGRGDSQHLDRIEAAAVAVRALYAEPTSTAQAAPAADYDHGPQSVTVAEAARHVGKWLNERPNRPLDLRDVAMLCAHAQKAPAAGAVDGMPPGISALMCVISSLRDTAHFSDEEGELTDELRTLRDWAMTQATAPTPAAQADRQPAPVRDVEREAFKAAHRHLELDEVPDAWARPMFKHSHVEASWLGWIARAARVSENGQPATQGNELLTVAERNIRSFLRSATFKSESDREAALSCVDVLWAAARAPADSVLEDAARSERERICAAIKAEDDYCVYQGDYMLDSDDCIKIVRGEWVRPDFSVNAARKQGGKHD